MAVTDSDEVNMIACMAAKRVGVPLTMARVRNSDYLDTTESVSAEFTGIDYVIQPETAVAEEMGRLADAPGALEVETFAGGMASMVEVEMDGGERRAGKPCSDTASQEALLTGVLPATTSPSLGARRCSSRGTGSSCRASAKASERRQGC